MKDDEALVGLVISEIVRPERLPEYKEWSAGISAAATKAEGFRARQVIEPRDEGRLEYLIVLKFDSLETLNRWHESDEFQGWLSRGAELFEQRTQHAPGEGVELWYSRPADGAVSPPFWKRVALGVLAVYPSIILLRFLTTPILTPMNLPPDLNLLISVTLLSCWLTWPLMPWLTRVLSPWLYAEHSCAGGAKDG